jgi:ribonuclease P protein component
MANAALAKASAGSTPSLATLKRRADFLRVRKGARWATASFVLEAKARAEADRATPEKRPRFGFTVTRQIGKAVERNRIRRRLKAAVREVGVDHAKGDFDYVLIARRPALTSAYTVIVADLVKALERVHGTASRAAGPRRR